MNFARMALVSVSLFSTLILRAEAKTIRLQSGENSVQRSEIFRESTGAKEISLSFRLRRLELETEGAFSKLSLPGIGGTSDLGMPILPFQAVTVEGNDFSVSVDLGEEVKLQVGRLYPAQEEPCRCPGLDTRPAAAFADQLASFRSPENFHRVDTLGDFRGVPVNRVVLLPHRYDVASGTLHLYPNAQYKISYKPNLAAQEDSAYDYLVISPRALISELEPWLSHKRSIQGLRFQVVAYEDMGVTNAASLKAWMHAEYARARFKYSLIVGGDSQVPQMRVSTTTDRNTPSDLPYYAMGGDADVVPEVYSGRIVASDAATLRRVLAKWMAYERDGSAAAGWSRAAGIASNEGANPSDAEYVQAIQSRFSASLGTQSLYFYQNNADSNPASFNEALNAGAWWVTYLGHGSGTSWSSFGSTYAVNHIAQLRNSQAVKPVWIDVACLNGILSPDKAGAHLMGDADPAGDPIGTAAYYGGTVLISWHPPAIFARGLGFHVASTLNPVLGEALQAGQKYLADNHTGLTDIASNQRWYHLQGDPSMRLRIK